MFGGLNRPEARERIQAAVDATAWGLVLVATTISQESPEGPRLSRAILHCSGKGLGPAIDALVRLLHKHLEVTTGEKLGFVMIPERP